MNKMPVSVFYSLGGGIFLLLGGLMLVIGEPTASVIAYACSVFCMLQAIHAAINQLGGRR
jgi:type II secretory pathway component PulM